MADDAIDELPERLDFHDSACSMALATSGGEWTLLLRKCIRAPPETRITESEIEFHMVENHGKSRIKKGNIEHDLISHLLRC